MKAVIQLMNHKDTNAILTRLGVISQMERNSEKSIECDDNNIQKRCSAKKIHKVTFHTQNCWTEEGCVVST